MSDGNYPQRLDQYATDFDFVTTRTAYLGPNRHVPLLRRGLSLGRDHAYISSMFGELYNTDILTLSAGLINSRLDNPDGTSRKVSKLCGSWLEIDLNVQDGVVSECALRVQACALGQASAAIIKSHILGANLRELQDARNALFAMLKEGGSAPAGRFAQLALLSGVKDYPARHTSIMLAFDAAVEAMEFALENA